MPDNSNMPPLIDLIICDTAPLGEGGDTYGLSMIADGIVMVIEAGKEQKEALCDTHAFHLRAPTLGIVINRQKAGQTPYYYARARDIESRAPLYKESNAEESGATPRQYNNPAHEEQTASEVPGVHFAAAHAIALRKIAERPVSSAPRPTAPLTSATEKLAQIDRLIPKTPIVFPLLSSGEYNASPATPSASTPPRTGTIQTSDISAPLLLQKNQQSTTTDALIETNREPEFQVTRSEREAKTQFKTYPGKRD